MTVAQGLRSLIDRRDAVLGINRRNLELVYRHNKREFYPIADDKLLTKQLLADTDIEIPRILVVCPSIHEIDDTIAHIEHEQQIVVKPASGSGGNGILVLGELIRPGLWRKVGGTEIGLDSVARHLANIVYGTFSKDRPDRAFVEERIRPHPVHAAIYADGLCDFRVITLNGQVLQAMLRIPTAQSGGRANLHQGGIGLGIDIETGLSTQAVWRGRHIDRHPDTGAPLLGIQQPSWERILASAKAAAALPLGYLGTDLVVDQAGRVLLLEINARPGLEIQNVNGLGLARRLAEVFPAGVDGASR